MKLDYNLPPDEMELIEKFLRNELTPEEATLFNERKTSDQHWIEKINETRLLLTGLQEPALQQSMDRFHATYISGQQPVKGKVIGFNIRWAVAAAAMLVVSLATWLLISGKNRYEKLYAGYYTPDPGLLTAMGPASNYSFEKGMVEYKNEEYTKALHTWSELARAGQQNDTLHYFMAMVSQALGQNDSAKKYLEKIVTDNNHSFYSDACWYLGLIYLKEKDTEAARISIEKSDHPKKAELLNAIKQN